MAQQTIESNEFYDLFYHEDSKIVHHVFKEFLDSKSFRDVLEKGTEVMAANKAKKWLADNLRQKTILSNEDNMWATTVWFPNTLAAGWKYWAIVVPDSLDNRVDLMRYIEPYHAKGINVKVFSTTDSALEWLKGV